MSLMRRLRTVALDCRWDGVALLALLPSPAGRPQPGFGGLDRPTLIAMLRRSFPGADFDFADLPPAADAAAALAACHAHLHDRGGLRRGEIVIARAGRQMMMAVSHRYGDGLTVFSSLLPACAHAIGGLAVPWTVDFGRRRVTLPAIIAAAVTFALRTPWRSARVIRESVAEERRPRRPADPRVVPAQARYAVLTWRWPGAPGERPRAITHAVHWRSRLTAALPAGALDPGESWLIVGLRGHPLLRWRRGNATTRMRMPTDLPPEAAIEETRRRVRMGFAMLRAGYSATVQQGRQLIGLLAPERELRAGAVPPAGPAPTRGLVTAWTHNRFDDTFPEGIASAAVSPGLIAANVYDCGDRSTIVLSAYVDEPTMAAIVAATRGMMTSFGYEERDPA